MDMMKRLMGIALASVFALTSTWAVAEGTSQTAAPVSKAVQMTEAELDQITAAGAITQHVVFNAGNANVFKGDPTLIGSFTCVNCAELGGGLQSGPAGGAHNIINRGHPGGKVQCFGAFRSFC
jgi:ABC-type phosphate transport system substrate-binding protein